MPVSASTSPIVPIALKFPYWKFVFPDSPSAIGAVAKPASGISAVVSPIVFAKSGVTRNVVVTSAATIDLIDLTIFYLLKMKRMKMIVILFYRS